MSTYLIINILIISVPLLLSFDKNLRYYRNIPYLLQSILFISSAYIAWDVIATNRGDWAFNPEHLAGIYILGLPIEEIFFFITVPYSSIFIYETIKFYVKERILDIKPGLFLIPAVILIAVSFVFQNQDYTFTVGFYTAAFFIGSLIFKKELLRSGIFWLTILICFVPFLIVNYFLTSIPVVTYNDSAFFAKRFITIPYEDFFYSFSMVSLWILFYELAKEKMIRK